MNKNLSYRNIFYFLVRTICWVGFLYQFINVTSRYLKYQTSTKISYGSKKHILVPSLTIAFPLYVPFRDLVYQLDPQYNFDSHQRPKTYLVPVLNITIYDPEDIATVQTEVNRLYSGYDSKQFLAETNMGQYINDFKVWGCVKSSNVTHEVENSFGHSSFRAATIIDGTSEHSSCTLMHRTAKIQLQFNNGNFIPFIKRTAYAFLLHTNDVIQHYKQMQLLKTDRRHFVTYNVISVRRLKAPYQTACKIYNEQTNSKSKSDCVSKCVFRAMVDCIQYEPKRDRNIVNSDSQERKCKTYSERDYNHLFCYQTFFYKLDQFSTKLKMPIVNTSTCVSINNTHYLDVEDRCFEQCPDDCEETMYFKKVKSIS